MITKPTKDKLTGNAMTGFHNELAQVREGSIHLRGGGLGKLWWARMCVYVSGQRGEEQNREEGEIGSKK